ncbi:MAG TPA: TPM domain-containing protein, partial [Candidatus Binatia bacterium]
MKNRISFIAAAVLSFLFIAAAPTIPPLKARVNDYANLLPAERARALEQRLEQFENQTGHQIAVLTVPTLDGEDIEGFGIRVAESWKLGKKGADNGAVLVIAQKDRKLRIEVGYGLE